MSIFLYLQTSKLLLLKYLSQNLDKIKKINFYILKLKILRMLNSTSRIILLYKLFFFSSIHFLLTILHYWSNVKYRSGIDSCIIIRDKWYLWNNIESIYGKEKIFNRKKTKKIIQTCFSRGRTYVRIILVIHVIQIIPVIPV